MIDQDQEILSDLLVRWEDSFDDGVELSAFDLAQDSPHLIEALQTKIDLLKSVLWIKQDPARRLTDGELIDSPVLTGVISNRYEIEELVGSGGFGQVYRAKDLKLKRQVAIKIGHSQATADSLVDEARLVAMLKHPNIVQIFDIGQFNHRTYLVFDFIDGESLDKVLLEKQFSINESVSLLISLCDTLHHAHSKGCIHRDIKPGNIIIASNGAPMITDFGVAATFDQVASKRVSNSGTLQYMAPEQIANEIQLISPRTDIHALGLLLFELLTGQLPYQAATSNLLREEILLRQPKRLRPINPELSEVLEKVIDTCLSKHPDDRFSRADELGQVLSAL